MCLLDLLFKITIECDLKTRLEYLKELFENGKTND